MFKINNMIDQTLTFAAEHSRLPMKAASLAQVDQHTVSTLPLIVLCIAALSIPPDQIEKNLKNPSQ